MLGPSLCPECPPPAEKPLCVFKCLRPTVRVSAHGSIPVPGDAPPRFLLQKPHLALAPTLTLGDSRGPATSVPSSWQGVVSASATPGPGGSQGGVRVGGGMSSRCRAGAAPPAVREALGPQCQAVRGPCRSSSGDKAPGHGELGWWPAVLWSSPSGRALRLGAVDRGSGPPGGSGCRKGASRWAQCGVGVAGTPAQLWPPPSLLFSPHSSVKTISRFYPSFKECA